MPALSILVASGLVATWSVSRAQADGAGVLELRYTPVARAQVAIWIEDASGEFLTTVALTEAVAFRGIGNRPGASQMNSGYRWPYGRREGVLPIWAHRRAAAPGAKQFPRVIFQQRIEGYASQTAADQSKDSYYCLQFDNSKSTKDQLDAVSCATQFNSDKGRYLTQADVAEGYAEPWETREPSGVLTGDRRALPLSSVYPPRMDAVRCTVVGGCYDHQDVLRFGSDVRAVMPEIDAITRATAPGDSPQKVLFTLPGTWPKGDYVAWIEVNVEGDYNNDAGSDREKLMGWNYATYPTPTTPDAWDYYAKSYGYPYRGQPSLAYKVPFTLGPVGESAAFSDMPVGRSSWEHWATDYGKLESITFSATDARHMDDRNGSGADRLRRDGQGHRLVVTAKVAREFPEPGAVVPEPDLGPPDVADEPPPEPHADRPSQAEPEQPAEVTPSMAAAAEPGVTEGRDGVVIAESGQGEDGPIGSILDLRLLPHPAKLHAHEWIRMRFRATYSEQPIHEYEVRIATEPIVDDASFLRVGRPAKNANNDAEGSTALMLPVGVRDGTFIEVDVGDLVADTRYFIAVRATDDLNRHGPISVAEISTPKRTFATVTPCFVATAAYGTPLAAEIASLRHFRDRYLSVTALGRAFVDFYQDYGPRAARVIEQDERLRGLVRRLLVPLVALVRRLP